MSRFINFSKNIFKFNLCFIQTDLRIIEIFKSRWTLQDVLLKHIDKKSDQFVNYRLEILMQFMII